MWALLLAAGAPLIGRYVGGPTMKVKGTHCWWLMLLALVAAMVVLVPSASAVHDLGLFQLDRNAVASQQSQTPATDDWDTLFNLGGNNGCVLFHHCLQFTGIIDDVAPTNPVGSTGTSFQGGGSKDDLDITQWLWDPGEPLDKDDITHAYAAAYSYPGPDTTCTPPVKCPKTGDLIVYFGLDRFANNGSAQVGFWFLQDPNFGPTTTPQGGGFKFSGVHKDHDVLVQSNFTQGGVISSVTIFEWLGGALQQIGAGQDCIGQLGADLACATVNQSTTQSPWPFTPKFPDAANPTAFPTGSFFEGALDVTQLVPGSGCFSRLVAETRSSTPFNSRLKDFALGNFSLCDAKISITPNGVNEVGKTHTFTVSVQKKDTSNGFTFGPAGGINVTGSLSGVGSFSGGNTCTTASSGPSAGTCTLTITSPKPGISTVSASANVPLQGDNTASVTTNGSNGNSGPATKRWVDARIKIEGTKTNEVGTAHTFTVTFEQNDGTGSGWTPVPDGTKPVVTISPLPGTVTDNCGSSGTTNGTCTVVINSNSPGVFTANASGTVTVGEVELKRDTDTATAGVPCGGGQQSCGPAVHTFIDAPCKIELTNTNAVCYQHTFSVTIDQYDPYAWLVLADGTKPVVTISPLPGTVTDNCGSSGTTSGVCTVVIKNGTPGVFTANASGTVTVGGVELKRDTDPATAGVPCGGGQQSCGPAVKTFVDARIKIEGTKTNEVGAEHTFTVTFEDRKSVV